MCEPSHSIVQFPVENLVEAETINVAVQNAVSLDVLEKDGPLFIIPKGVRIGSYLNYSRLGFGHSEALGRLPRHVRSRLPRDVKYEVGWWDRSVHLDGPFFRRWDAAEIEREESLESATIYAHRSSIGDTKMLRRFLEQTLNTTTRPWAYMSQVFALLSSKGRDAFDMMIRRAFRFHKQFSLESTVFDLMRELRSRKIVIGIILKLTRTRNYLTTEWADDSKLWLPSGVTA